MPILFNLSKELGLSDGLDFNEMCHPSFLILAPTRELALQIYRLCYKLTKVFPFVHCSLVVGGVQKVSFSLLVDYRIPR